MSDINQFDDGLDLAMGLDAGPVDEVVDVFVEEPSLEMLRDAIDPNDPLNDMEGVEKDLEQRICDFKDRDEELRQQVEEQKQQVKELEQLLQGEDPSDPLASLRMIVPRQVNYMNAPELALVASRIIHSVETTEPQERTWEFKDAAMAEKFVRYMKNYNQRNSFPPEATGFNPSEVIKNGNRVTVTNLTPDDVAQLDEQISAVGGVVVAVKKAVSDDPVLDGSEVVPGESSLVGRKVRITNGELSYDQNVDYEVLEYDQNNRELLLRGPSYLSPEETDQFWVKRSDVELIGEPDLSADPLMIKSKINKRASDSLNVIWPDTVKNEGEAEAEKDFKEDQKELEELYAPAVPEQTTTSSKIINSTVDKINAMRAYASYIKEVLAETEEQIDTLTDEDDRWEAIDQRELFSSELEKVEDELNSMELGLWHEGWPGSRLKAALDRVKKSPLKTAQDGVWKVATQFGCCKQCESKNGQLVGPANPPPPYHANCRCKLTAVNPTEGAGKGVYPGGLNPPKWVPWSLREIWRDAVERYVEENGGDPNSPGAYGAVVQIYKAIMQKYAPDAPYVQPHEMAKQKEPWKMSTNSLPPEFADFEQRIVSVEKQLDSVVDVTSFEEVIHAWNELNYEITQELPTVADDESVEELKNRMGAMSVKFDALRQRLLGKSPAVSAFKTLLANKNQTIVTTAKQLQLYQRCATIAAKMGADMHDVVAELTLAQRELEKSAKANKLSENVRQFLANVKKKLDIYLVANKLPKTAAAWQALEKVAVLKINTSDRNTHTKFTQLLLDIVRPSGAERTGLHWRWIWDACKEAGVMEHPAVQESYENAGDESEQDILDGIGGWPEDVKIKLIPILTQKLSDSGLPPADEISGDVVVDE